MLFVYNTETLKTILEPNSEAERRAVLKLIQVFLAGGEVTITPRDREPMTMSFRGHYEIVEEERK